jgi:hypothetical protein
MAIKYIGLLESPIPRKIELIMLYPVINGIPIMQIVRYVTVSENASGGVNIIAAIGFTAMSNTIMIMTDKDINRVIVFPMADDASSCFPAPTARPISTVAPIARPTIMTVIICITWLATETAVILSTPLNCPTINRSAIPYSVWRKYDSKYGKEKYTTVLNTLPVVKFFSINKFASFTSFV